jgi:hypothetical protein
MVFEMESSATGLKGLNKSAQGDGDARETHFALPNWATMLRPFRPAA